MSEAKRLKNKQITSGNTYPLELFIDDLETSENITVHEDENNENESYVWEHLHNSHPQQIKKNSEHSAPIWKSSRRLHKSDEIKSGAIRNVIFLLDASEVMQSTDFKPDRYRCYLRCLEDSISDFLDENPLSQVGLVKMIRNEAETISLLSDSAVTHMDNLKKLNKLNDTGGTISILNGLERALGLFSKIAFSEIKEIIIILGSTNTRDPGNIHISLDRLELEAIITSVITMAPEMNILKKLCRRTKGSHFVVKNQSDLLNALQFFKEAPFRLQSGTVYAIPLGFPGKSVTVAASLCICHNTLNLSGYICPRCRCKVCALPTVCPVCQIRLARVVDIAKLLQQIQPPPETDNIGALNQACVMCNSEINEGFQCKKCSCIYCEACNICRISIVKQCPMCL